MRGSFAKSRRINSQRSGSGTGSFGKDPFKPRIVRGDEIRRQRHAKAGACRSSLRRLAVAADGEALIRKPAHHPRGIGDEIALRIVADDGRSLAVGDFAGVGR